MRSCAAATRKCLSLAKSSSVFKRLSDHEERRAASELPHAGTGQEQDLTDPKLQGAACGRRRNRVPNAPRALRRAPTKAMRHRTAWQVVMESFRFRHWPTNEWGLDAVGTSVGATYMLMAYGAGICAVKCGQQAADKRTAGTDSRL